MENNILDRCKVGSHDLAVIHRTGNEMEELVVRWCLVCGSVVVDLEFDNRTKPGHFMKMRSPEIAKV